MDNSHPEHDMGHAMKNKPENEHDHHHMIIDFKRRFWICLILTVPILILSPHIQHIFGVHEVLRIAGDTYILFILSSIVYFYGGYPFFKGIYQELHSRNPGMMTLVAVAITTA
ncbi:MAG TPA: heavy metal translocating P-type ATPase, partial [Methanobacterium sp.]|nr:heavy metal translocating P-type ATPase [Methanobacterium sp.]